MTMLIGGGVFLLTFAAGLIGLALHRTLPEDHRSSDSKDTVRLVQALIASMATLVLGLLIASASGHFRSQADGVTGLAADLLVLDVALEHAGPGAQDARKALRDMLDAAIQARMLRTTGDMPVIDRPRFDAFYNAVAGLHPANAAQSAAQARALDLAGRMVQARATLMVRDMTDEVQWPFLGVLTSWLTILFLAMGLFTRTNSIVVLAMLCGSLAVAGAIFLIVELENPQTGLLRVSDSPLRFALQHLGR